MATKAPLLKDYAPARRLLCFRNRFPDKLHISYINIFPEINFPKITPHVVVCDSENYIEILSGNCLLG